MNTTTILVASKVITGQKKAELQLQLEIIPSAG